MSSDNLTDKEKRINELCQSLFEQLMPHLEETLIEAGELPPREDEIGQKTDLGGTITEEDVEEVRKFLLAPVVRVIINAWRRALYRATDRIPIGIRISTGMPELIDRLELDLWSLDNDMLPMKFNKFLVTKAFVERGGISAEIGCRALEKWRASLPDGQLIPDDARELLILQWDIKIRL